MQKQTGLAFCSLTAARRPMILPDAGKVLCALARHRLTLIWIATCRRQLPHEGLIRRCVNGRMNDRRWMNFGAAVDDERARADTERLRKCVGVAATRTMMRAGRAALKGCATRTGKPASALDREPCRQAGRNDAVLAK